MAVVAARACAALHELQVVDDDEVEAVLGLEAAGLRAQVHDVDARGVVDVDGGLGDAVGRVDEPRRKMPGA